MKKAVEASINYLITDLTERQSPDGAWRFCYESTPITDAYMIILMRSLEDPDETLVQHLVQRLESRQNSSGSWSVYPNEKEGNLSSTIEAYTALLYSGYKTKEEPNLKKAKAFIEIHGGLKSCVSLTKVMLAIIGQYSWPHLVPIPVELILLPQTFPLNFYDLSGYARVHLAPLLILADQKFVVKSPYSPDLSHLLSKSREEVPTREEWRSFFSIIEEGIKELKGLPEELHHEGLEKLEAFLLERIEPDGTLYSYFSSTFMMIFALLARGYSKKDPLIVKALNALKAHVCQTEGTFHVQNALSTVWDTALLSYALQEAGVSYEAPSIKRSFQYLIKHQQTKKGDWAIHDPHVLPGGWGFSGNNTINPDVDDSTAALRALRQTVSEENNWIPHWNRGVKWVLSMQNHDGGWPSFEKNTDNRLLTLVPFDGAEDAIIDPSSADLTGRALEFLGNHTQLAPTHPQIKSGIMWLKNNQEGDGSWYGRWGICYIYGTWAALTGLSSVGVRANDPAVRGAVDWINHIQNEDGGWGESCQSDVVKRYVPLGTSNLSQTAWALDALIAGSDLVTEEIQRGIRSLITQLHTNDWTTAYPTGAGLPGVFYTYYHSYNYIWPLLTLSHYHEKYVN